VRCEICLLILLIRFFRSLSFGRGSYRLSANVFALRLSPREEPWKNLVAAENIGRSLKTKKCLIP
jgi:hypothetical protein